MLQMLFFIETQQFEVSVTTNVGESVQQKFNTAPSEIIQTEEKQVNGKYRTDATANNYSK